MEDQAQKSWGRVLAGVPGAEDLGKSYLALVDRPVPLEPGEGTTLEWPLCHGPGGLMRAPGSVWLSGRGRGKPRPARSELRLLARGGGLDLLRVDLVKGQHHQVRAHLAAWGYPLLGDRDYGGRPVWKGRTLDWHLLHGWMIRLPLDEALSPGVKSWIQGAGPPDPGPGQKQGRPEFNLSGSRTLVITLAPGAFMAEILAEAGIQPHPGFSFPDGCGP